MDEKILKKAVKLRHEMHEHPELSMEERWTRQRLMDFLKDNTDLEINDRGLWFYAAWRGGGKKPGIAFRADFDALPINETTDLPYKSKIPNVSHKCGHDGHSSCLAAFAMEVSDKKPKHNIFFAFQHAEEVGGGGEDASKVLLEEKIDEVYGYHNGPGFPLGMIACRNGTQNCASQGMIINFEGVHSHASEPEKGVNPAYTIADVIHGIPGLLKKQNKGLVLSTIVNVKVGSEDFGINPGDGILCLTNRAEVEEDLRALEAGIRDLAEESAAKYGVHVTYEYRDSFPENKNWPEQFDKVKKAAENLGLPLFDMQEPVRGSEDYGWFTKRVPGAFFAVGAGEGRCGIHMPEFDFNDELIPIISDIYWELVKML
jgi:amidohydrolase